MKKKFVLIISLFSLFFGLKLLNKMNFVDASTNSPVDSPVDSPEDKPDDFTETLIYGASGVAILIVSAPLAYFITKKRNLKRRF